MSDKLKHIKYKAFVYILLLICCSSGQIGFCENSYEQKSSLSLKLKLSALEQHYFGHAYPQNDKLKRLCRLEELVFGQIQSGSEENRTKKLLGVLKEAEATTNLPKVSTLPKSGLTNENKTAITPSSHNNQLINKPKSQKKYPLISFLEAKILHHTYSEDAPSKRLDRLESRVFGATTPKISIEDRISKLQKIITPQITANPPNYQYLNPHSNPYQNFGIPKVNDFSELNNQLNMMMQQMEQQMNDPNFNGFNGFPDFNQFTSPPNSNPFKNLLPPSKNLSPNEHKPTVEVPPYNDPNSI